MATSRSWATLAPELLSSIHELLADEFIESKAEADSLAKLGRDRRRRDKRTALPPRALKPVSRVNKHWHRVANEGLYRTIFVHREETIRRLVRAVTRNPDLLHLIRSVTVDYKYSAMPRGKKPRKKLGTCGEGQATRRGNSFTCFSRLKALTLAPGSVETAPKALGANIQCLRGLISLSIFTDVGKGYAVDGPVNGVLSEWLELAKPTLTQLSLTSNTTSTWNTCKIRVPQGLQLKKLRLVDGACRLPGLQHLFCDGTLEYLSLDCRRLCVPSSQLCREVSRVAQSLRGLHIQVPIDLRATETRDTLATMLSSVRNVRILHLQAGLDYLVGNVTNLPTSVRRLAIDVKPTGRDDQERAIACLNAVTRIANAVLQEDLPSLAHLSVTCSTLKQLSDFDIDRAVFEQSITAAAEKGITLEFMDWFPEQVE